MSTIKLLGIPSNHRTALQRYLPDATTEEAELDDLRSGRAQDEVWLVHIDAALAYTRARPSADSDSSPHSLLWIPEGRNPLPSDEWWEDFSLQLLESKPEDKALLQRISHCPQVIEWNERVSDVPRKWFLALSGSPVSIPVEKLPFSASERRHLEECHDCRSQVYDSLQQEASIYWEASCPTVSEIGNWLEDKNAKPQFLPHIAMCGMCRATALQQIRLYKAAGIISTTEAAAKSAAVDLAPKIAPKPSVSISAGLQSLKQTVVSSAAELAAALVSSLTSGLTLQTATRSAGSAAAHGVLSNEEVIARLTWGEPLTYGAADHWLRFEIEGSDVLMQIGHGPAEWLQNTRLDFYRDGELVVSVASLDGELRIAQQDFKTIVQARADQISVVVLNESSEGE